MEIKEKEDLEFEETLEKYPNINKCKKF